MVTKSYLELSIKDQRLCFSREKLNGYDLVEESLDRIKIYDRNIHAFLHVLSNDSYREELSITGTKSPVRLPL